MNISDSVIAKQAYNGKRQIIIVSEEEKKLTDEFENILQKLQTTLNQNEQNEAGTFRHSHI